MFKSTSRDNGTPSVMVWPGSDISEIYIVHPEANGLPKQYVWAVNCFRKGESKSERFSVAASTPGELNAIMRQVRQQIDESGDIFFIPQSCGYSVQDGEKWRTISVYGADWADLLGMPTARRGDVFID